jgi:hypothetical protein
MSKDSIFVISKVSDTILRLKFKDDVLYSVDDVLEIKKQRLKITTNKHALVVDVRNNPKATNEALTFVDSAEITSITSSMALIVDGFLSIVIGNFHMKFNEGKYPTKIFKSEVDAIAWINSL